MVFCLKIKADFQNTVNKKILMSVDVEAVVTDKEHISDCFFSPDNSAVNINHAVKLTVDLLIGAVFGNVQCSLDFKITHYFFTSSLCSFFAIRSFISLILAS